MVGGLSWLVNFFSNTWTGKRVIDAIMAFITMVSLVIFWWLIIDISSPITRVERELIGVPDGIVYVGTDIHIKGVVCSTKTVPQIKVTRTFIDGLVYTLPSGKVELRVIPAGCFTYFRTIHIPNNLPPGKYMQHTEIEVRINPLRTATFESPNIHLDVRRPVGWTPGSDTDFH
jgi:hypothetical protein